MEKVYNIVGMIVLWSGACLGFLYAMGWIIVKILNHMAQFWKISWRFYEYIYYQKIFKEWVKDKDRHPDAI